MKQYAELELSLHRLDATTCSLEFRFSQPNEDSLGQNTRAEINIETQKLQELQLLPDEYSQALTGALFGTEEIRTAFAQARALARRNDTPIRMRLVIGTGDPELHALRWELLRDPQSGELIATDENILLSRYLTSMDWQAVRLQAQTRMSALVIVASPSNLAERKLASIDVPKELELARKGLVDIQIKELASEAQRPTLDNIVEKLRDPKTQYEILYLVCHGWVANGKPQLALEKPDGTLDIVPAADLITRIKELQKRPRLVMLVSCQSAGKGTGDALSAIGPRLAEAGVPAVIAMQDNISMDTASQFLPEFFKELQVDGQIDRALTTARGKVRKASDFWVPVLFMRLKSGRLWYVPGLSGDKTFDKFPRIIYNINDEQCTPILGPGLVESMLGSLREIAHRWAEEFRYPMAVHEQYSLPQVAQFLTINQQDEQFPFRKFSDHLKKYIRNSMGDALPPNLQSGKVALADLIEAMGAERRKNDPNEPHRILAELPLPIFITTNADTLMEAALKEAKKDPQSVICPWNENIDGVGTIFDKEPDYEPTVSRPLVFHMFGRWDIPESVVLTEDQYFDFLIGLTRNKSLIPEQVRQALSDSGLLFLGFQTEDWVFRVLFRSIQSQQGGNRRNRYAHVAAQIEPEDGQILEPERARRYLEQYFVATKVDIYWGSPLEFMTELIQNWRKENQ
jgi:CHAT domain-containing protein